MHLVREDLPSQRKARGAFFTPSEIAEFLVQWAVREPSDRVLEPSCGEAAFLLPAGARLRQLGAPVANMPELLHGHDIHSVSVVAAHAALSVHGLAASIETGDFFKRPSAAAFDVVVGNPPYVRYQNFSGEARALALEAALRQGVRLNGLSSSWAAFAVHAASFLKPDGRLGLVLPAELLSVKYAAQIRKFLLTRFKNVRLVFFDNLVFPGVLEDVVLLLAEGQGSASHFEVYQAKDAGDLKARAPENWVGYRPRGEQKWTSALLPAHAIDLYEEVIDGHGFEVMADWGDTYLGAVTGNNGYFTLTKGDVERLGLEQSELERISPPGARHLRGLTFSEHAWSSLADEDARCYLFSPNEKALSAAARKYIDEGVRKKVHQAYKCKVREPWWKVPIVPRPDFLFAYMNHDRPRLVRNGANVQLLNSIYGVRLHAARRKLGEDLLPIASLNSMTLLGAEVVGRSYGGGMLKHEPTEVAVLPVPSSLTMQEVGPRLRLLSNQVSGMLRRSDIGPAIEIVDRVLLKDHLGFTEEKIAALRAARTILLQRRMTRSKASNGKD
jgi:adenine-specific DNA methylase